MNISGYLEKDRHLCLSVAHSLLVHKWEDIVSSSRTSYERVSESHHVEVRATAAANTDSQLDCQDCQN
jgi:hypothetical protein